ncbi:hypothetical protein OCU04_012089 [Sclerotinia nivalis]|uniref:Uncharacterized protein n=1 Tax=Sclerotinia nivalis TaxID=352851 RepID=A0A9X0AAJ0_9HELO|nr:hypothetical protein OCU04_012089 [Sclerotinia nivalis]
MYRNTKHGLIFLALLFVCGGGIAVFFVVWLKPHSQHQSATKRGVAGTHQHDFYIRNSPLNVTATGHSSLEKNKSPQVCKSHIRRGTSFQHRNRHRSSYPETDIGNLSSYSSIVPTSTAISTSVQSSSTTAISVAPAINIYSPLKMVALSTLLAAGGFQSSAISSSNPRSGGSHVSATSTSAQPSTTFGGGRKHVRSF